MYTMTISEKDQDHHAAHEVAATLMTVAKGGAPAPASLSPPPIVTAATSTNPQADTNKTAGAPSFTTLFSSIGFGIDLAGNATEACVKAVRDANERGKLNTSSLLTHHQQQLQKKDYQFQIQLGVPGLPAQSPGVPQNIETPRLAALLPPDIPKQFEIHCGGLLVPSSSGGGPQQATCVVVASLTLQQKQPQQQDAAAVAMGSPTSVTNSPHVSPQQAPSQPRLSPPQPQNNYQYPQTTVAAAPAPAPPLPPAVPHVPTTWAEVEQMQQEQMQQQQQQQEQPRAMSYPQLQLPSRSVDGPRNNSKFTRNKSIEMLARISAEMIGAQERANTKNGTSSRSSAFVAALPEAATEDDHNDEQDDDNDSKGNLRGGNSNYKKLPPGTTPKNHKRLFVQHTYRDHSHEVPLPEELDLVGPQAPVRTPNAAFPLKLHEILSQIENDGHDDVIGWLPHGRSFKILKQKEFVDEILPNYFVMTKKSSFLRQLNLYGFNRLSQVGNDQGSYYHEKFLRGMKFLSRRMQRQKVNGNGIRAAGNPDEEPSLSRYPTCPPIPILNLVRENAPSHEYLQMYERIHDKAHHQHHHHQQHHDNSSKAALPPRSTRRSARSGPASAAVDRHEEAALALHGMQDPTDAALRQNSLQVSFPLKLQRILDKLEAEGQMDILSWLPHGRAFIVHDPDRFVSEIMPVFFNQTKYSSFQRQCHMYQFERITAGPDKNAYHNANFLRGRPELAVKMQRTRVNGKGTRRPGNPLQEPDLYALPPLPPMEPGTIIEIPLDLPPHHHAGEGSSFSGSGSGDEN